MPRKMASATVSMGMVKIPFGIAKASAVESADLKSICECGGTCGYLSNDEGHKVECDECGATYPWWNSVPKKAFPLGDELVEIDPDDIPDEPPVETGSVEKVVPVKSALLHYTVEGNYYLLPEDDFEEQYGVLVGVLNEQSWALLTYLQTRSKTRRYAIISEGGVLIALQLADKKPLPDLDYGTDAAMEQQAATMLESMVEDDPALPDVENQHLKELVRAAVKETGAWAPEDEGEPTPTPEV